MLLALLDREHEGYRGDRFRDVAAVVLGVMVDRRPDLLAAVVDMMRAHPDECQAGLYVLLAARSPGARRAMGPVVVRHEQRDGRLHPVCEHPA